jgi:AraC-like DNA-binding protein
MNLSDLAHEGEYYDQPHFNMQFKKYSKKSPKIFAKDRIDLK